MLVVVESVLCGVVEFSGVRGVKVGFREAGKTVESVVLRSQPLTAVGDVLDEGVPEVVIKADSSCWWVLLSFVVARKGDRV